jgi:hypothetical protein
MVRKLFHLEWLELPTILYIKTQQGSKDTLDRHKEREDWTKGGIKTAGFYAKNVLWNKPSIRESINDLNKKYKGIKFKFQ